jgi:dihydroorotate dehydrogenase
VSWLYRNLIRPCLFTRQPEAIHNFAIHLLSRTSESPLGCAALGRVFRPASLPLKVFGLEFPNPVGLAAGMDKNGQALAAWEALGFGFNEIGAVTWYPQPGNLIPRVFRVVPDEAIINRMGSNNAGAEALARQLRECQIAKRWPAHPMGLNIGKSRTTPLAEATHDYAKSLEVLWPFADFFVINVSSPNTPNLRDLQDKQALDEILAAMQEVNEEAAKKNAVFPGPKAPAEGTIRAEPKPILVKVAPDLAWEALDQILELVQPRRIAGLVATNTTISRPETQRPDLKRLYAESGGLSGRPLRQRSTEVIRHLYRQSGGKLPLIGVGGIFSASDAWEKITAGATLVQVYTGFVYQGPGLIKTIVNGLRESIAREGFKDLSAAVGSAA